MTTSPRAAQPNGVTAPLAVTIAEGVRLSGISRTALYESMKRGDLAALKAGRRTLINFADLARYVAALPEYRREV